MDLAKACRHVLCDQDPGALQRDLRGLRLPAVGAEMVPAQEHPLGGQADLIGHAPHEVTETRGTHARVATVLVDLVGRRLDQRLAAGGTRVLQRSPQHQRMRRAHRVDADGFATTVAAHQVEQRLHARSSGSMARSAAAANASTMATSFNGCGIMPRSAKAMSAVMSGAPALVSGDTTMALP